MSWAASACFGNGMPGLLERLRPGFQFRFIKTAAECFKVNFH